MLQGVRDGREGWRRSRPTGIKAAAIPPHSTVVTQILRLVRADSPVGQPNSTRYRHPLRPTEMSPIDVKLPFESRRRPSQLGESLAKAGAKSPFDSFSRAALRSCPTASPFHRGDDDAVKFETSKQATAGATKGSNDRARRR